MHRFAYLAVACAAVLGARADGQTPVPSTIKKQLYHKDLQVRLATINSMQEELPPTDWAPYLVPLAIDNQPEVRRRVMAILWRYESGDGLAYPLAYAINRHRCDTHVNWLIRQIRRDEPFAPHLLTALASWPNPQTRAAAVEELARVRTDNEHTKRMLVRTLRSDQDVRVRAAAARGLGQVGPAAKSAFPTLITALKVEDDIQIRRQIANSLRQIKPNDKALHMRLTKLKNALDEVESLESFNRLIEHLESLVETQEKLIKQTTKVRIKSLTKLTEP